LKTEIGDQYRFGDFTLYPSLIVMYQSQTFLNYYYGVQDTEATPTRNAYTPSGGWEVGMQTYIHYPLYKNYALLLNLRGDLLPKTAQNSPIVNEKTIYSGLFSIIYKFQY
jgi:outer membrane protein